MNNKVCMIVFNHFKNDARVLKEAYTLMDHGYKVKVYALYGNGVEYKETRNGLEIERIEINPIHQRLFGKKSVTKKSVTKTSLSDNPKPSKTYKDSSWYDALYQVKRRFLLAIHKPLTYYDFYLRFMKKIKSESYDIFHAHDLNTLYPAYKGSKLNNGKLIYDSHELYIERNKPKTPSKFYKYFSSQFENYLIKKADKVITVGDCIAKYLSDKYKVVLPTVIMNAPSKVKNDIVNADLRKELKIDSQLKLAIYCGAITFNRGLEKLIESLILLPDIHLVMMGYGKPEYLERLQYISDFHKVSNRFSFYGPVAPNMVTAYTTSADVGIAPIENICLSYYFCAPNKVFEYMIGGIPVAASNFPELEKIVLENNIGTTFDPDDINSIADAINNIFSNKEKYLKMKENTKTAAEKYNWENESKKLLELYSIL